MKNTHKEHKAKATCPRCGKQFDCGCLQGNPRCWCVQYTLSEGLRTYLGMHYTGCLCPDCMGFFVKHWEGIEKELTVSSAAQEQATDTAEVRAFAHLVHIMRTLRKECPWDGEQRWDTLGTYTVEEVYELIDAIRADDTAGVGEELGDLLMHLLFYMVIGEEAQRLSVKGVIQRQIEKLVYRHPHVFGAHPTRDPEVVAQQWERLKQEEQAGTPRGVLAGVPHSLPAWVKAIRVQEKARAAGFDWEQAADVWPKVKEEIEELGEAMRSGDASACEAEYGDVLFSLLNVGRLYGLDPSDALAGTTQRFIQRFERMEAQLRAVGKVPSDCHGAELEQQWQLAKRALRTEGLE